MTDNDDSPDNTDPHRMIAETSARLASIEPKIDRLITERQLLIRVVYELAGAAAAVAIAGTTGGLTLGLVLDRPAGDDASWPILVAGLVGIAAGLDSQRRFRIVRSLQRELRSVTPRPVRQQQSTLDRLDAALTSKPEATKFLTAMVPLAAAAVAAIAAVLVAALT